MSIAASWDPVTSDPVCGPVSYDVTILPSNGVVMRKITNTTYSFIELTPYTIYNITVTGRNDAGVGESAKVIVNAPTIANVVSHGKLHVYCTVYVCIYIMYCISNPKQPSCKKKEYGPQKDYGEKRCEIQGGSQEMAVMVG